MGEQLVFTNRRGGRDPHERQHLLPPLPLSLDMVTSVSVLVTSVTPVTPLPGHGYLCICAGYLLPPLPLSLDMVASVSFRIVDGILHYRGKKGLRQVCASAMIHTYIHTTYIIYTDRALSHIHVA